MWTLYCQKCQTRYAQSGTLPSVCPTCSQETTWLSVPTPSERSDPFVLTYQDRQFLHQMNIASE